MVHERFHPPNPWLDGLYRLDGVEVIGETRELLLALGLAELLDPDVVVVGWGPGLLERQSHVDSLRALCRWLKVLLYGGPCQDRVLQAVLELGMHGFVGDLEPTSHLPIAFRELVGGGRYFCPYAQARLVLRPRTDGTYAAGLISRLATLTRREQEVVRLLAKGLSVRQIAGRMSRSIKTIDNHKTRAMAKLDIHDRVDLARFAIREGLVEP